MNKLKSLTLVFFLGLLFTACSNDDDIPVPVNEEEVITTMTVSLSPNSGGTPIILKTVDLDGDGPNPPVITVAGNLMAGTTYNGSIELLNETVSPADNITELHSLNCRQRQSV